MEIKFYSLDIFDTLVYRLAKSPRDIFYKISHQKPVKNIVTSFADIRIQAEFLARQEAQGLGREEVTLLDIYGCLQRLARCSDDELEYLMNMEISTELELIRPTKFGQDLLESIRKEGTPYILTSDMYLPKEVIQKILNKCQISGFSDLFLSCDIGLTKHNGTLFSHIVSALDVQPANILHIGDNQHSDVNMAKKLGLQARLAPASCNLFLKKKYSPKLTAGLNATQPLSQAYLAQYFEEIASLPDRQSDEWDAEAYFEMVGHCVLAPMMTAFIIWLHDRVTEKGIKEINFMARDGKFMHEVFLQVFDNALPSNYLAASRRMTCLPFSILPPTTLKNFIETTVRSSSNPNEFYRKIRAGDTLKNHMESLGFASETKFDSKLCTEFIQSLSENSGVFMESFSSEKEWIREYYGNFFQRGRKVALVDIGWKGSIQRGIFNCITDLNKSDIHGFYLATTSDAYSLLESNGYNHEGFLCQNGVYSWHCHNVHLFMDVLEFLMSADHGSLITVGQNSEWIASDLKDDEVVSMQAARLIQKSAMNAIASLQSKLGISGLRQLSIDYEPWDIWSYMTKPTKIDAYFYENIKVFSGIGDEIGEYLTNVKNKEPKHRSYRKSRWQSAYAASLSKWERKYINFLLKRRGLPKIPKV